MNKIWHYTTQNAALEVWRGNKLRLTNIDFVNDSSEKVFFLSELDSFLSSYECSESRRVRFNTSQIKHRLSCNGSDYLTCFSLEADDVAQWERYGGNARGVAICFDMDKLNFDSKMLSMGNVEYFDSVKLQTFFSDFHQKHGFNSTEWSNMANKKSLFAKQAHFQSEKEVRIVEIVYTQFTPEREEFYAREDTICPCVFLKIPEDAIIEIKMGPKARRNARFGWKQLTDPQFQENNSAIWKTVAEANDESLDIIKIPITQSACTLV